MATLSLRRPEGEEGRHRPPPGSPARRVGASSRAASALRSGAARRRPSRAPGSWGSSPAGPRSGRRRRSPGPQTRSAPQTATRHRRGSPENPRVSQETPPSSATRRRTPRVAQASQAPVRGDRVVAGPPPAGEMHGDAQAGEDHQAGDDGPGGRQASVHHQALEELNRVVEGRQGRHRHDHPGRAAAALAGQGQRQGEQRQEDQGRRLDQLHR